MFVLFKTVDGNILPGLSFRLCSYSIKKTMICLRYIEWIIVINFIKSTFMTFKVECNQTPESPVPSRRTNERVQSDLSWVGPLVSATGSYFDFEFSISLHMEKCCPVLVVTTAGEVPEIAKGGCYNVTRSGLDMLHRILPTHMLLDWKTFSYGVECSEPNSENMYRCYGLSNVHYNGIQTAHVYAFYPCYAHKNVDLLRATIVLQSKQKSIECIDLSNEDTKQCKNYYDKAYLPNIFGTKAVSHADLLLVMAEPVVESSRCHKYVHEFLCRTLLPECVPSNTFIISPCRSMCQEVFSACKEPMKHAFSLLSHLDADFKFIIDYACDLFPDESEDYCFTKNVSCTRPKQIQNGVLNFARGDSVPVHFKAHHHCSDGYELEGNSTVYCEYSGEWSHGPRCTKEIDMKLVIKIGTTIGVIGILMISGIILFIIYRQEIAIIIYAKFGIRFKKQTEEDREYDAFIAYSQEDIKFVKNKLLKPLERKYPQFKICIHHRDFELGATISANILNAIKQSKRTIIVLSQNFINSPWCHFEFEHAHIQLLENQSYKLIVIALSEPKTLHDVPELIEAYIKTRTYLMRNDKWFAKKLFYHMPNKSRKSEVELTETNLEDPVASTREDTSISKRVEQTEKSNILVNGQIKNHTQRHTWIM